VAKLADKVQQGTGAVVEQQSPSVLGRLISNPSLTGVDQTRDWYVGVYANGTSEPTIVFAIPALKTEDLVGALGAGIHSQVQENWVLYTEAESIPQPEGTGTAAKLLDDTTQKGLTTGDLCVFVNAVHLSTVYASQIELAQDKVLEFLNQLRFMPQQSGINLQAAVQMYGTAAEAFFQALHDAESALIQLNLSEDEIAFDKFVRFAADSGSAKFISQTKTASMDLLGKLPANWPVYYGFNGLSKELIISSMQMSLSMFKTEQERQDIMQHLTGDLEGITLGEMTAAMDVVENGPGVLRAAGVTMASPQDKWQRFSRDIAERASTIETEQFTQISTLAKDAETVDGHPVDLMTTRQEYGDEADPLKIQQKMQSVLFGSDGMQTRTIYLKDRFISCIGGGIETLETLLKSLDSSRTSPLTAYRTRLMPQANALLLIDLPALVGRSLKAASHVEDFRLPLNSSMIDNLALKSSYAGFALGAEGNTLHSQARIPVEQITGMTKLSILLAGLTRPSL
jgi:hypothetical protein